jgi:hypothetical protein
LVRSTLTAGSIYIAVRIGLSKNGLSIVAVDARNVCNEIGFEVVPNAVGYENTWENSVNNSQVRILVVKGCAILHFAVQHIFNADSPATIIHFVLLIVKQQEAFQGSVKECGCVRVTHMYAVAVHIEENLMIVYSVWVAFINKSCHEFGLIVFKISASSEAQKSINRSSCVTLLICYDTELAILCAFAISLATSRIILDTHCVIGRVG